MGLATGGIVACPDCRGSLEEQALQLSCTRCGALWPPEAGFPKLYREESVTGTDRLMRRFYNGLPSLHDPLTRHLLPWLQRDSSEAAFRDGFMSRVDIRSLSPRGDGEPLHILEVGVGAGANLPLIARDLPADVRAVVWGLDLAKGMLRQCRRTAQQRLFETRLLLGDAHSLPFADSVFDRVFHCGATGSFRAPKVALAEMARVAKPGTPIVVVDEQLDRTRDNTLRDRLAFELLTFYDPNPHCPTELLPAGSRDVEERQLNRFYYCLTFSVDKSADNAADRR